MYVQTSDACCIVLIRFVIDLLVRFVCVAGMMM